MLGRTPGHITTVRPMKDGVIADFTYTERMLQYSSTKFMAVAFLSPSPRVLVCVPFGSTQVVRRAIKESAEGAGARSVDIVPEPMAAADGVRAPEEGSIIVIVATDAPLTPDQLKRLTRRVSVGLGRVGSIEGDGSGDIFLEFSTANSGADEGNSAEPPFVGPNATIQRMQSWKMNPMFTSVVQAIEEAIINAIVAAKTMTGADYWTVPALPRDQLQQVLRKHGQLKP